MMLLNVIDSWLEKILISEWLVLDSLCLVCSSIIILCFELVCR